jgi:ferrochelatase
VSPKSPQVGVLVMAYGTPGAPEEVEAFYTDVRRGRPPSPEQLADLVRRYEAIGGVSPLAIRTGEQVTGIQRQLERRSPGRFTCVLGNKHSEPCIETAIVDLAAAGVRSLVGLVLAPHFSRASVGEYVARASLEAARAGMSAVFIEHWHDNPALIDLLAQRARAAFQGLGPAGELALASDRFLLLVTAHSLPVRAVADGDPYVDQLRRTAQLVSEVSGFSRFEIGWQSAGRTPEPWLGPDILDKLRSLPGEDVSAVVVCAAGFTSDHLEVLYDLDIDAHRVAVEAGVAFARTASLNDEPAMCAALADLVVSSAEKL